MPTSQPSAHRILFVLLAATLLLRVFLVLGAGARYDYQSDDREYLRSAQILLSEGTLTYNDPSRPTAFITPAYPGFLAVLIHLTPSLDQAAQAARLIQAFVITLALWLLHWIGTRLFDARTALLAVILCCLYPPLWLIPLFLFTESLFILALFALIALALIATERPTLPVALGFGLMWALAVYVRPTIALWPGIFLLVLAVGRHIPIARLIRCGVAAALVFVLCLAPWWARNYQVSGGSFIPLTQSSGNPLLLGTYPWTVPALFLDQQRTWHKTDNLWINDRDDTQRAIERLKSGFTDKFWLYASWYTVGKFLLFWGDVFYWMALPGIPLILAIGAHGLIIIFGFIGIFRRRPASVSRTVILSVLVYMTVLHMIYLPHSRYSLPLMPLLALFAARQMLHFFNRKKHRISAQWKPLGSG